MQDGAQVSRTTSYGWCKSAISADAYLQLLEARLQVQLQCLRDGQVRPVALLPVPAQSKACIRRVTNRS